MTAQPIDHHHATRTAIPSDDADLTSGSRETPTRADTVAPAAVVPRRRRPSRGAGISVQRSASRVRRGAATALAALPRVLGRTAAGARRAVGLLETMPDGTLRSLAAASLGLGAGLSFTRAGRLGGLVGAVPAVVMGTVLATRPTAADDPAGTTR